MVNTRAYREVPALFSAVTYDEESGTITVFALNIDNEPIEASLDIRPFGMVEIMKHIILDGDDLNTMNSFEEAGKVRPHTVKTAEGLYDKVTVIFPKLSWNVVRMRNVM